ncbi:glycosyl transferase [Nitratiruptor sp. YY08-26]|uniref:glycosyltransferase family 4 protein n=1 Tax=unclassified Nitratiruptor TaxID=2624044 RepID=UPI001914F4E1|nr:MULTISPECIES: glycosyltransferase family 4 protein [unclassified Nitratiruptor]BCD62560.1 glycosyl transferase [Nitratiruptor sp. YY08-13]BCD66496.1 glycosyl transferase [Nitratiruptor sp. YY08-26]
MKILFIPHVPNKNVINRVYELAKNSDGIVLDWYIDNSSLKNKIFSQAKTLMKTISLNENFLSLPLLFKPESFASYINTYMLNQVVKKYKIDVVVNANALLFDVERIEVPVIYDLVDDHLTKNLTIGLTEKRVKKIEKDIKHARGVVCVTESIEEKVKKIHPKTITIENGVYIDKFKKARSLKKEFGLENKKVFGYIGGVEEWTGIEKACEAYKQIKSSDTAMMIVGDSKSSFFQNLKKRFKNDIIFTGAVAPNEVANYFKTLDIGLIPFELNDFTNNAFPIKALEYGLGGAQVIATPLKVLEQKRLPYIHFCPIEDFPNWMQKIEKKEFSYDFTPYSWQNQAQKLLQFIKDVL